MHPPSSSCKALYRYHPQLRLAWQGRSRHFAGEMNPGSFALVQLYHRDDVGSLDDPHTFREFWEVKGQFDAGTGELLNVRAYRGPVFNKHGGTSKDYDPLTRVPIFVCTLDGGYSYPDGEFLTTEDVCTGKFMFAVEAWGTSIKERARKSRIAKAKEVKSEMGNMTHMFMDDLKHSLKSDPSASSPIIARKHAYKHNEMQQVRAEQIRQDLNKSFGVDDEF